jgi:hypothetical protein
VLRYCRAFPAVSLGEFAAARALIDPAGDVVYIWDDLRIGADPLDPAGSTAVDDERWPAFCEQTLGFAVPDFDGTHRN